MPNSLPMKKPNWIFKCNKCSHQVYVDKKDTQIMLKKDCPECGEEAFENWILIGEGNYDKEYGTK